MKKIFAIIAAATLFAGAAQAQGLGNILGALGGNSNLGNTINSVIYAYTGPVISLGGSGCELTKKK